MKITADMIMKEPPGERFNRWLAEAILGYLPDEVPDYANDYSAAFDIISFIGHIELKTHGSLVKCRILMGKEKGPLVEGNMKIPAAIAKAVFLAVLQEREKQKLDSVDSILF